MRCLARSTRTCSAAGLPHAQISDPPSKAEWLPKPQTRLTCPSHAGRGEQSAAARVMLWCLLPFYSEIRPPPPLTSQHFPTDRHEHVKACSAPCDCASAVQSNMESMIAHLAGLADKKLILSFGTQDPGLHRPQAHWRALPRPQPGLPFRPLLAACNKATNREGDTEL